VVITFTRRGVSYIVHTSPYVDRQCHAFLIKIVFNWRVGVTWGEAVKGLDTTPRAELTPLIDMLTHGVPDI